MAFMAVPDEIGRAATVVAAGRVQALSVRVANVRTVAALVDVDAALVVVTGWEESVFALALYRQFRMVI